MKKLILCIGAALLLLAGGFYFWDLKNEVSEIKSAVTGQTESAETAKESTEKIQNNKAGNETAENLTEEADKKEKTAENIIKTEKNTGNDKQGNNSKSVIDDLTEEKKVTDYLKENGQLPDYYITKKEAQREGWEAKKGNLCEVLPGRAIGGDIFTNREKTLPVKKGRIWYEADLNYNCGRRNAQRVVFSNDGLIFVTHDHYKSFEEIK